MGNTCKREEEPGNVKLDPLPRQPAELLTSSFSSFTKDELKEYVKRLQEENTMLRESHLSAAGDGDQT